MSTRRAFLKNTAAAGAALTLGFRCFAGRRQEHADFKPNHWLRLRADGTALLVMGKSELGQGVRTALAMILAEELELPWSAVRLEQARPGPDFRSLSTGGSMSVATLYAPLRKAGATARAMLVAAAADRWKVAPEACRAELGRVLHPDGRQSLSYPDLLEAASRVPPPPDPPLKPATAFRYLGKPMLRIQGQDLVTGAMRFTSDRQWPGLAVAVIARCPVVGGKATSWDDAALRLPGVMRIVAVPSGVAVVAEDTWSALQAREALKVVWDLGPQASFSSEGFEKRLRARLTGAAVATRQEGEALEALGRAARVVEAEYVFPFQAHAPMEPPCAIAEVHPDRCTIWVGSQNPNAVQQQVAKFLGLKPEEVTVHVDLSGGGFGRRLAWDFAVEAAAVAKAAGRAVKLVWSREDDLQSGWFHPMSVQRLQAGLDDAKRVQVLHHRVAAPSILLSWMEGQRSPSLAFAETLGAYDSPYFPTHHRVDYAEEPCHLPLCWWRSIQAVPNTWARECFVDEVALALRADPIQLRLDLMGAPREVTLGRDRIHLGRLRAVLEAVRQEAGWDKPRPKRHALGVACCYFHGSYVAQVAEVCQEQGRLKVLRIHTVMDCGPILNPLGAHAQVEGSIVWALSALQGEITFTQGRVSQTSYRDFPVLRLDAMPEVRTRFLDTDHPPTGIGEPPVVPVLPAVLNAWARCSGQRLRRLPLPGALLA